MTFLKAVFLTLVLSFPLTAFGYVTSQHVLACGQHPQIELIAQIEFYKKQGASKEALLKSINPGLDPKFLVEVKKALAFVYDKKHEVSAEITALVACLNQELKEDSTIL